MKANNNVKLNIHDIELGDISNIVLPFFKELPLDLTFSGKSEDIDRDIPVDVSIKHISKNLTRICLMPSEHIVDSIVYSGFNQLGDGYNVSFEKNYVLVSRSDEELGKLEAHLYSDYHSLK